MAHTRPISCIRFAPDGQMLATTSWDRQVTIRRVGKEYGTTTGYGTFSVRVSASHAARAGEDVQLDLPAQWLCRFDADGRSAVA